MTRRLSLATLPRVPPVARPRSAPHDLDVGIVHLGLGAFHRAHQAVYTEDAVAAEYGPWGICGVSQRSPDVAGRLHGQDGLYSVLERGPEGSAVRVVGMVREALFAGGQRDTVIERIAAPATRIVSLTVTEKGYRHDPATGHLNTEDPEVVADLAGNPPRTVVGQVVAGMRARHIQGAGPITVLCCDNLPSNGATLRRLVEQFCSRMPDGSAVLDWIADNVAFPSTMVDRIVPVTGPAERAEAAGMLGLDDQAVVVAEPFRQWVIEDAFSAGRPAWERAGAILTRDVGPYETMKLRLLNGAHSGLAYLGGLAGFELIADAVREPVLREFAGRLMDEDVLPTLTAPPGVDLQAYTRSLLERFANPALGHRTGQVAMDGTQKLPQRLLGTARDRLAAGQEPYWVALAVAAWMRYVTASAADNGRSLSVDDPLAGELRARTSNLDAPPAVSDALMSLTEVFGPELGESGTFRDLVATYLEQLAADGTLATVRGALGG